MNAYVNVFEDHLFVKQTLSQIATSSCDMEHICPAVSSMNSLVSHLSETLTSSILTQLNQLDPHSTSFQVVDHIILSSVAMIPSLSQSLSIPCVPPILDCLTAILLASDEVCAGDKSARETARIRLINLYVDDICLRILAAHRRALTRKGVPSADGAYWNTLVKCCLNLLMNMCYRCSPVQVTLALYPSPLMS